MPWFGLAWLTLALLVAWAWRADRDVRAVALAGAAALIATMLTNLWQPAAGAFVPVAVGIWCAAGGYALFRRKIIAGSLYGASGLWYILIIAAGWKDAPFAPVHLFSDGAFLAALLVLALPPGALRRRGGRGRAVRDRRMAAPSPLVGRGHGPDGGRA